MRKLSVFLLLATAAAAPSVAALQDSESRDERRAERRAAAEERSEARAQRAERRERAERPQRVERMQRIERVRQADAVAPAQGTDQLRQQRLERLSERRLAREGRQVETGTSAQEIELARQQRFERLRARRLGDSNASAEVRPDDALTPRETRIRTIPNTQPVATTEGSRTESRRDRRRDYRDGNYQHWTNHWRGDRRYDWRRYRDRNRSLFRLGFYYDPFGWSYRRFNIGFNLWPSYYSSRYWLNDPWSYRLPPAYGPYRWVRYWDDALLVNIYTGEVVDVIHNFFW